MLINPTGWMRIPAPQATTLRKHPRPEEQLTAIFDIICRIYLNNVDLQRKTKDMDTAYFKFCVNNIWETERGRGTNPSVLDYPAIPQGFSWDPAGDELLDACIYYSDHFVDAPIGQGIARRANVHAPSAQARKRQKNAHELMTEGDPIRLGFKELVGEPLPRRPDVEDKLLPPPLPRSIERPIEGGFGATRSKTYSGTRGGVGGQPNRIYKAYRLPDANDSQSASPD
ncbi:b86ad938-e11b-4961-8da9-a20bcaafa374-CDS [Sclerotinia trifoliorum]|uniref:B86ad938-e11b-4961-8da9-a20bcaafa374-CDS n=1 Tax=Sclerotinia trifoliorum TaxID=28548 RepID=A0A8H2ZU59_9HELO|nr:b86ad938-e11b-4961-8da9-a20bcaafa374-CDS [Sclerotinia trifoliorum]